MDQRQYHLRTYPSPDPSFRSGDFCWVRGGVAVHLVRNWLESVCTMKKKESHLKNNVVEWAGPNQTAFFFPSFFPVFFFLYLFFWLRPFRFLLCLMIFAVASQACTFQPSCYIAELKISLKIMTTWIFAESFNLHFALLLWVYNGKIRINQNSFTRQTRKKKILSASFASQNLPGSEYSKVTN